MNVNGLLPRGLMRAVVRPVGVRHMHVARSKPVYDLTYDLRAVIVSVPLRRFVRPSGAFVEPTRGVGFGEHLGWVQQVANTCVSPPHTLI